MREEVIELAMMMIAYGGEARSKAMEAIMWAKQGDFLTAHAKLAESKQSLIRAHKIQTQLMVEEANGGMIEGGILLIHAQDHLMNAMTIKDLAIEFVDLYERFATNE